MGFAAVAETRSDATPKYLRLAKTLERQMKSGVLRVGDRLPSIRELRDAHQISMSTAVGCYLWLERQGYVRARPKSGFYVSRPPLADGPQPVFIPRIEGPVPVRLPDLRVPLPDRARSIDLGPAVIDASLLPSKRLNRSLRMALSAFDDSAVRYEEPRGNLRLRRQIARLMFRQGATASPDDIVVTAGATEALSLTLRAITRPGDVVAVESPGCYEFLQALETFDLRAVEIPHVTGTGIDLTLLAEAIRNHRIAAVLVEATCHNALGDCASDESKAALVALGAAHDIPIIEGDPFGELVFSGPRPRPLKAFDSTGVVLQCSSLAHYVAPGFNLGWASAGRWQPEVERLKSFSSVAGTRLTQLAMAEFLESGAFDRHVKALRLVLWQTVDAARQEILTRFPKGTRVSRPDGGFVLWIQLPDGHDGADLQRRAAALGIRVLPGVAFSPSKQYVNCVRIACGYPIDVLKPALRTLSQLL